MKDAENRSARVMTLREIEAGEELYAEYGEGYWRRARGGEGGGGGETTST